MDAEFRIVVLGGGVGGLATALALACRGMKCQVIEPRSACGDIDRGDILQQSSVMLLHQWGIEDLLLASGAGSFTRFLVLDERGRTLLDFDGHRDLIPPADFTALEHPLLEQLLERAVVRSGMVKIRRGVRCTELLLRQDRVIGAVTTDGVVEADLTVIATGSQSHIVDRYFATKPIYRYGVAYYNSLCERDLCPRDAGIYVLGREGILVMAPLPGHRTRLALQFRLDQGFRPSDAWGEAEARRRLSIIPEGSLRIRRSHVYVAFRALVDSFWRPGAVILGDAGHTTHPAGGQGMNLAFRDADTLAELLSPGMSSLRDLDTVCRSYSVMRRHAARDVLKLTHILGLAAMAEGRTISHLRISIVRLAQYMPWLKRQVFSRLCWTP